MKLTRKTALLGITIWIMGTATAIAQSAATSGPNSANQKSMHNSGKMGTERTSANVDVIDFEKGKTNLTDADKSALRKFVENTQKEGKIKDVMVAVWSDEESPAKARKDLPKEERKMAEKRGDSVKNYLKDNLKVHNVKVYNMAEGTNWLAEAFHTTSAELHEAFASQNHQGKLKPEVLLFRDHGGPSKAVLVVQHDKEKVAH